MHQENQNKNKQHKPVLLEQVLKYLNPRPGESYLDLTAGYGGHAKEIIGQTGSLTTSVLIDRDKQAVDALKGIFPSSISIRQQDFYSASQQLKQENRQFDLILADLGVSSPHLNKESRGFAFNIGGPLDMRMDQSQQLTAETIINSFSEDALTDLLYKYGEEPKARQIARAIVQSRPLKTTDQLAAIALKAWPGRSRNHPATRTFQAFRIAVNDELIQLERSLPIWLDLVSPGGRIAIISFHSLEDRIVKQTLAEVSGPSYDASFELLTRRPITASQPEIVYNPRARSAKLRAAAKIKTKGN